MGYIPSEMQIAGKTAREAADIANDTIGVTKAQEAAMLAGSVFGWQTPPPTRKTMMRTESLSNRRKRKIGSMKGEKL